MADRNLMRSFKTLLKRVYLPVGTRLYDLRHTCATLLLNGNVHAAKLGGNEEESTSLIRSSRVDMLSCIGLTAESKIAL